MRSYPGAVARVLRENSLRGRTCPAKTFRSPTSTSTTNHVAAARTDPRQLASAQGLLRAAATQQGNGDGFHGSDVLRWRWGLCAAAATAVALGFDNKQPAAAAAATSETIREVKRRRDGPPSSLPSPSPVRELPVGRHAVADAVESASPWVVNIVSGSGMTAAPGGGMKWDSGSVRNMGSGFVISGDGLVVTNAHVVERYADGAVVITLDGGEKLKGKVQAMDRKFDLALVKVDVPPGISLPVAKIGRSVDLRAGEFVVAMGSPQGLSKSCTLGIVSATARRRSELVADARTETIMSDSANFIQTDAAIASGNSGGPLIDLDGRVIGINTLKLSGTEGVGFAIPIDMAWQVVEELRTRGRVDRPQLGMRLVTTDTREGRVNGVMILSVTPGGVADRAGLRFGDVITEFDGKAVTTTTEVLQLIGHQVGRAISMTVVREGKDGDGSQLREAESDPAPPPLHLTLVTESDLPRPQTAAAAGGGGSGSGTTPGSPSSSPPSQGAPPTTLTS